MVLGLLFCVIVLLVVCVFLRDVFGGCWVFVGVGVVLLDGFVVW